jgi:hypothetical protein
MHVYRYSTASTSISGYLPGRSDWSLLPCELKYVMADNSLAAVDLLRSSRPGRIEIASIEHACKGRCLGEGQINTAQESILGPAPLPKARVFQLKGEPKCKRKSLKPAPWGRSPDA